MKRYFIFWILFSAALLFTASSAATQDYSHIRIVRLSFAEGTVQYQRPGQDWQDASINLPIQEGFSLRTIDGYAEVEFEQSLTLRMGTNSTVEFSVLALINGGRATRLTLSQGSGYIDAKLRHGDVVSVVTPQFTVNLPHDARFRVDATPAESWAGVFHGKVSVASASGTSALSSGRTLHETSASSSVEVASNPPADDFDKWVAQRDSAMNTAADQTDQLMGGSYTEGFADLYDYGLWDDIPGYGPGWIPYGMAAGWMPFMNGEWMFMGLTGWNWVSAEPWGWLPYHFGSWVDAPGIGWAWLPIGASSWLPANATWVQVNNQLGWIPNGPPVTLPRRKLPAAAAPTAILAANNVAGVIRAGAQMPLARTNAILLSHAPSPPQLTGVLAGPGESAATSVSSARSGVRPALGAPNSAASRLVARLSSMPRSMTAPHSLPAPVFARGAAGFRGGFAGGNPGFHGAAFGGTRGAGVGSVSAGHAAGSGGSTAGAGGASGVHR